jgi:hypothetical protein
MCGVWALSFALLVGVGFGCESSKKPAPVPGPEKAPVAAKPAEHGSAAVGPVGVKPAAPAPKQVEALPAPPDPIAALFPVKYMPSETLPDQMRRRIRFRLRDKSQAAIALHHIIDISKPDGSREVFALYGYSFYEDCLHGYATRKEGREHCLAEGGTMPINRAGAALGAVRALFGPPDATTPADTGGSLSIWSMAFEDELCDVDQYHHSLSPTWTTTTSWRCMPTSRRSVINCTSGSPDHRSPGSLGATCTYSRETRPTPRYPWSSSIRATKGEVIAGARSSRSSSRSSILIATDTST